MKTITTENILRNYFRLADLMLKNPNLKWRDVYSVGQLESKVWLIEELEKDLTLKEEKLKSFENHVTYKQKKQVNSLADMIQKGLKTEEDWTVFLTEFSLEYKSFNDKISSKTSLSKNDIKILALQKLNLTTNEMALVMNITLGGVKKARNRLREKLNLSEEITLNEFVSKI